MEAEQDQNHRNSPEVKGLGGLLQYQEGSIVSRVLLKFRPPLGAQSPLREQVAEPCDSLGAADADCHLVRPLFARYVRHLQAAAC